MYYTYVLRSEKDNSYYIGQTKDTDKRLKLHNSGNVRSTKGRKPYELVFTKSFETRSEAINYEKKLKKLKKRDLLEKIIFGIRAES